MDRITEQVKSLIPITWDAMSKDAVVGDSVLAARIEYAKQLVLGEAPSEEDQKAMNILIVEFVAKTAALEIISPAAIDYWKEQKVSVATTGTHETVAYEDRIRALEKLAQKLLVDLAKLEPIVESLIPTVKQRRAQGAPLISTFDDELLTPNPQDIGRPYAEKANA